jgi:hypothetical protein
MPSHPLEGRIAIVTDAGWDAVDAKALLTNSADRGRRSRVVPTPRRWRQVSRNFPRGDGDNKPVTEESTKETVKTIAQGRPDCFR